MDKLANELLNLLRDLHAGQQHMLELSLMRREAMRAYDIERLESLMESERTAIIRTAGLELRRKELISRLRMALGKGVEPTVTEIAKRAGEPMRKQLLAMAAQMKGTMELLERNTRINATVSEAVVKGLAKVLKIVTGLAQHAGLYMRNGRKASLHGIHLLEVTA